MAVDDGITEIVPTDFEIGYTIDQSVTDHNSSIGAGSFPACCLIFAAARPLNAGTWHPMGTLAGSNFVTNAFGDASLSR